MSATDRFFVLTGGPGSGKTTLLDALAAAGHRTVPEAGRAVIRDMSRIDGPALPWRDRALFAEAMLLHDLAAWRGACEMGGEAPVFFDRGLADCAGYLTLCGLPLPPHVERAIQELRYAPRVFVAPFWPEIFGQDAERRQDAVEAERTFETMMATYRRAGYETVLLPRTDVGSRVRFVEGEIARAA
ncbi:AAA family ATPase [Aureimonas pseudogalii]|uniref:Putative ATPase n=1 Tax=Aureimonas pseudogalii TaxID=1744844 RepID=A0A7W6EA86_9HYPH|nr:AAA family ATPase [Aureimonas pseudogalii]MBB3997583.1 putative ATPase [Aureimonas pseudogalii]